MSARIGVLLAIVFTLGCARDGTITRGADGPSDWQRRLESAIPLGISPDSTASILKRNGFDCQPFNTVDFTLSCEKVSDPRLDVVRRKWVALLAFQSGGVANVRGSTDLIRP
jgi:hypothetical protein